MRAIGGWNFEGVAGGSVVRLFLVIQSMLMCSLNTEAKLSLHTNFLRYNNDNLVLGDQPLCYDFFAFLYDCVCRNLSDKGTVFALIN